MSSTELTVLSKTLPAVTLDAALPTIVPTKPAMPKGGLKLAQLERFAPDLARDLYDRFDFAKSVHSGGEPSLSVKKAYGLVTTGEFRKLLAVKKAYDFRNRLIGVLGTSVATTAGGFGTAMALNSPSLSPGFAVLGLFGAFATLMSGMATSGGWQSKTSDLRREISAIDGSEAALERAKATADKQKLLR